MAHSPHEDISRRYVANTTTSTSSSSVSSSSASSESEGTSNLMLITPTSNGHSTRPTPFPDHSRALPDSTPTNPGQPVLTCPVSRCPLVFKGETAHGYLWRHLKRPGAHKRTGDEKAAWVHLHKIEHDRPAAAGITPEHRKREARKARAQRKLRAARFELRAKNMGITEEPLVAEKMAIWEGMYAAKQSGDDTEGIP